MGALISGWMARIARTFSAFTAGQKVVLIATVLILSIGGLFFSQWAGRPVYAPLFTGLAPSDASAVVEELNSAGTKYSLTDGGATILVPRDKVYSERVRLSGEGLPAGDTTVGYPLLDKQGITASEFQQQIGLQRAMEGELIKTIERIEGVEDAVVHLAMPKKDIFADKEGKPTASVLVKTLAGRPLGGEQVQSIVHLVSSSVEALEPGAVTVTDASGRMLSSSQDAGGSGDLRARQTADYETRITDNVRAALEKVVGPGNAVVTVTADLDFDKTTSKSRTFTDPNVKPLAQSGTEETYTGGGGQPVGGVLGPDNIGGVGDLNGDGEQGYTKKSDSATNAVNQNDEERVKSVGAVRQQGIGVLLNAKVAAALNPQDLEELISAAANLNEGRGDQLNVSLLPFDDTAAKAAEEELKLKEEEQKKAALMKQVKTASLIFVTILLIIMAFIGGRKRAKQAAALRRAEAEAVQRRMIELDAERIRALEAARIAGEIEAGTDPNAERIAHVRNEIGELVESQPEEVAALLRGWLADRRG